MPSVHTNPNGSINHLNKLLKVAKDSRPYLIAHNDPDALARNADEINKLQALIKQAQLG